MKKKMCHKFLMWRFYIFYILKSIFHALCLINFCFLIKKLIYLKILKCLKIKTIDLAATFKPYEISNSSKTTRDDPY